MKVDSHNIEFGYELLGPIPYAYELFCQGKLTETVSGTGSEPLYFFSPKHTINPSARSWFNTKQAIADGIPYLSIHQPEQPLKSFPDYKSHFANKEFKWKKPTLCICNRYNIEWSTRAINFFDEELLDWLFINLSKQYEIIYFPVSIPKDIQDNEPPMRLDDIMVARRNNIRIFTELIDERGWNEIMLMVFANCDHYITMNGGYSILASYFSGTNIIYSKPGKPEAREIKIKSFWRWYPNINNVRTLHVESYGELKSKVRSLYIEKKPCLNLLIRTHRPNYLKVCMDSVNQQTYPNINVVFICDSKTGVLGTRIHNGRLIEVEKKAQEGIRPAGENYGVSFPYNLYLHEAQKLVDGYIMFLDDDDKFTGPDSAERIMEFVGKNKLVIWKADYNSLGLKPSHSFGKKITVCDIGGICICYHSDHIDKTDWSQWKRADFRTAYKLGEHLDVVWVDEVLTGLQDVMGMGKKPDLMVNSKKYKLIFPDETIKFQYFSDKEIIDFEQVFKNTGICIELAT